MPRFSSKIPGFIYSGVQVASAHGRGGAARRPSHVLYLTRLQNTIFFNPSMQKRRIR